MVDRANHFMLGTGDAESGATARAINSRRPANMIENTNRGGTVNAKRSTATGARLDISARRSSNRELSENLPYAAESELQAQKILHAQPRQSGLAERCAVGWKNQRFRFLRRTIGDALIEKSIFVGL